jgi:hypothetical protein
VQQPWALPVEVLESLVAQLEPSQRGVVRHVSRGFRAAVRAVAEAGAGHPRRGGGLPVSGSFQLHASSLCGSLDILKWASETQECPWSLQHWMDTAAGEVKRQRELRKGLLRRGSCCFPLCKDLLNITTYAFGSIIAVTQSYPQLVVICVFVIYVCSLSVDWTCRAKLSYL